MSPQFIVVPARKRSYAAATREPQTWFLLRHFYDFHHSLNSTGGGPFWKCLWPIILFLKLWMSCCRLRMEWRDLLIIAKWEEFKSWLFGLFECSQRRMRLQPSQTVCQAAVSVRLWQKSSAAHMWMEDVSPKSQQLTSHFPSSARPACSANVAEGILTLRR